MKIALLSLFLLAFLSPVSPDGFSVFLPSLGNETGTPRRCIAKSTGRMSDYAREFDMDCYLVWGVAGVSGGSAEERAAGIWRVRYLTCDGAYFQWPPGTRNVQRFDFWDYIDRVPEDYARWLFTYNEPDLPPPQCYNEPEAVAWGFDMLRRARPSALLVCPAVSHLDYDDGWAWMVAFFRHYHRAFGEWPDCSAAAIHWYNPYRDPVLMLASYRRMLGRFGLEEIPLFITEWGSSDNDVLCRMLRAWENDPGILAHFYYTGDFGTRFSLLDRSGNLTDSGRAYKSCS